MLAQNVAPRTALVTWCPSLCHDISSLPVQLLQEKYPGDYGTLSLEYGHKHLRCLQVVRHLFLHNLELLAPACAHWPVTVCHIPLGVYQAMCLIV